MALIIALTGCSLYCPKCQRPYVYASHLVLGTFEMLCDKCVLDAYGCKWHLGYGQVYDTETQQVTNDDPRGAKR